MSAAVSTAGSTCPGGIYSARFSAGGENYNPSIRVSDGTCFYAANSPGDPYYCANFDSGYKRFCWCHSNAFRPAQDPEQFGACKSRPSTGDLVKSLDEQHHFHEVGRIVHDDHDSNPYRIQFLTTGDDRDHYYKESDLLCEWALEPTLFWNPDISVTKIAG